MIDISARACQCLPGTKNIQLRWSFGEENSNNWLDPPCWLRAVLQRCKIICLIFLIIFLPFIFQVSGNLDLTFNPYYYFEFGTPPSYLQRIKGSRCTFEVQLASFDDSNSTCDIIVTKLNQYANLQPRW